MDRWIRGLLATALVGAFAAPVAADGGAEAEALFQQGKDLIKAGKYAEACTAFEGSQRLDPTPSTLMNLADCRERNRELATAWSMFLQVSAQARRDPSLATLGEAARRRAARLEPRLSHLIVNVPDESRLEGLTIVRNGVPVDPATWNRAMPIDGGRYAVVAKAPDHEPWSTEVTVGVERDKQSVDVPRFKAVVAREPRRGGLSTKRKVALGLGGAAIASAGAAVGLELWGRSLLADAGDATTQPAQDRLYDRANRRHHLAQAAAGVTLGLAAGAAYLWLTGPSRADADAVSIRPVASPAFTGLVLGGGF